MQQLNNEYFIVALVMMLIGIAFHIQPHLVRKKLILEDGPASRVYPEEFLLICQSNV